MKPLKSSLKKLYKACQTDTKVRISFMIMHQGDLRSWLMEFGWKKAEVDAYYKEMGATHGEPIHIYGERQEAAAVEGKVLPSPGIWLKARRQKCRK